MAERSEIDHAREVLPGRKRRCFGSARDVLTGSDRGFLGCATREVGQQGKHVQLSGRCAGPCVLVPFYCDARTTRSHMAGAGEGRALRQSAGLHHTHRSHRGKVVSPSKPTSRRSWNIKYTVAPVFNTESGSVMMRTSPAGQAGMMLAALLCVGEMAEAFSPAPRGPLSAGQPCFLQGGGRCRMGSAFTVLLAPALPDARMIAPRAGAAACTLLGVHMQWGGGGHRGDFGAGRGRWKEGPEPRNDRRKTWERGDDGSIPVNVDEGLIVGLLADREKAKRRKEFEEADRLRDVLLRDHMIHVDDK